MTRTAITGAIKTARWGAVPAFVALALAAGAAPALADDTTAVILNPTASVTASGQLTVSGAYQCDPSMSAYAEISVSVSGFDVNGDEVDASVNDRVPCTGGPQPWQETLTPAEASDTFAAMPAEVHVIAWTPGDWEGQSGASAIVSVS